MYIIFALGMTAFLLCFALTPICRILAIRFDIVDHPDKERKFQNKPIPRIGGFAIVAAYAGALLLVVRFAPATAQVHIQHRELVRALLPAASVIFLTGLIDDLFHLKPWKKLAGQFLGAVILIMFGAHYTPGMFTVVVGSSLFSNPWINIPVTLLWLLACTNAVNLIDGLDGLASGVGLLATVTTLLVGVFTGNSGLVLATMPLAGALLAFLYYNFEPASVYLGDCGSLTIGFMLGVFSLVWSHHNQGVFSLVAPLMVLTLPLLDVGLAIARRYLRDVPIFKADRGHIHHMVLARGFKTRHTALILYAVCALAASLALLQSFAERYLHLAILAAFLFLVWAGVQYLGYAELVAAKRALSTRDVLRIVRDEIYLEDLERKLAALHTVDDWWETVMQVCDHLHCVSVEMYFHETYNRATLIRDAEDEDWSMTVPLGERGYLRITRPSATDSPRITLQAMQRLQRTLGKREASLTSLSDRYKGAA